MKKEFLIGSLLSVAVLSYPSYGIKLRDTDIDFGIQYRVMYNNSNIASEKQYDFFRQRLRLNFDVHTEEGVGGFIQIEFRGGWGGSSPEASDPRGVYAINAFNRLQARGIRYGYLYFPAGPGRVMAGILPANDQVDQMLFSADWDFNVGGVAYAGSAGSFNWRAAYVRLVEGQALIVNPSVRDDEDEHFLILDLNSKTGGVDVGLHIYSALGEVCIDSTSVPLGTCSDPSTTPTSKLNQTWIGAHATAKIDTVNLHGVVMYNTGKIGNQSNDGFLIRLEPSVNLGSVNVSLLGIYSSGDRGGTGFMTVQGLLGTGGYWGYTYIFSPHGPSDVNDFGLEVGNRGYGLITIQGKVDVPLTDRISAQAVAGWFRSVEDMPAGMGRFSKNLGTEFGVQIAANVGKHMNLEFGGAVASLGDAAKWNYQGNDRSSVNEIFARLQLEF